MYVTADYTYFSRSSANTPIPNPVHLSLEINLTYSIARLLIYFYLLPLLAKANGIQLDP